MSTKSDAEVDPDADLIQAFRDGQKNAFDEIVRRHQVAITRIARRYVKSDADAKDLSQRTFLRAIEKLATFRGESTFRAWLYRVAVNVALNHIRGSIQTESIELEDIASFTNALATEKLVAAEVWRKVQSKLEQLPPKQRLAVELRIFHEFSFEDIAVLVDSTEEAAKNNYHLAVKKLRTVLPTT